MTAAEVKRGLPPWGLFPRSADIGPGRQSVGQAAQFCLGPCLIAGKSPNGSSDFTDVSAFHVVSRELHAGWEAAHQAT